MKNENIFAENWNVVIIRRLVDFFHGAGLKSFAPDSHFEVHHT